MTSPTASEGALNADASSEARAEWCKANGLAVGWLLIRYDEIKAIDADLTRLRASHGKLAAWEKQDEALTRHHQRSQPKP
jgi:hypothetical protein